MTIGRSGSSTKRRHPSFPNWSSFPFFISAVSSDLAKPLFIALGILSEEIKLATRSRKGYWPFDVTRFWLAGHGWNRGFRHRRLRRQWYTNFLEFYAIINSIRKSFREKVKVI